MNIVCYNNIATTFNGLKDIVKKVGNRKRQLYTFRFCKILVSMYIKVAYLWTKLRREVNRLTFSASVLKD